MKILVSISFYTPYISGLTICARNYAEGLAQKKYDVTVITTQHDKDLQKNEILFGVKINRIPYLFRFHKGFFMPSFFHKSWLYISQNDVVIINLPQFEGFILAFIARLLGKRVISIYHCEVVLPNGFLNKVIEQVLSLSMFFSVVLSNRVVAYSQDYAESGTWLPFFMKKCVFILPPVTKPSINKSFQEKLKKSFKPNTVIIGVSARIAAEKGLEYLFEAIPSIEEKIKKPVTVLVAGPKNPIGEEKYWQRLQPLIEKNKEHIFFLGSLSATELGAFYSLLDVLVVPSVNKTEAFGLVQVESMMMGVPVVASDLPGVRIPTRLTGMGERIKIANSKDLAEKISQVISHKEMYTKNKKKVIDIFNYQKAVDDLEKTIHSTLQ